MTARIGWQANFCSKHFHMHSLGLQPAGTSSIKAHCLIILLLAMHCL